jgi:hypothetical protein
MVLKPSPPTALIDGELEPEVDWIESKRNDG